MSNIFWITWITDEITEHGNRRVRQPRSGANAAPINQTAKNLNSFFGVQFVHVNSMLARASNVK
jgi:hypothetical protein